MADGATRPLRILHLPVDLGGHARGLAAAQRRLGHAAISVSLEHSPFGFNGDLCLGRPYGARGRLTLREIGRLRLLWRSLVWADVIHCHFGRTVASLRAFPVDDPSRRGLAERLTVRVARLLWLQDLRAWRALGKRVAMTFYGDDIRPVALSLRRNPWTHLADPGLRAQLEPRDALKARLVAALDRHGVVIFATNPDLLAALPDGAVFLPYAHVELDRHVVRPPAAEGPLRLLHMPTDRDVKGTRLFIEAVRRLRARAVPLELTIIEGQPNSAALAAIAGHDVLLDQLRVGWFGGVAFEAMAMGKPVLAYINAEDEALVPPAYRAALPLFRADPSDVAASLARLAAMPRAALREAGLRARRFVEEWHAPDVIARQVLRSYGR